METFDVVIIGAGPAGLSSGLYCSRSKLKTLCIEKLIAGGQIINTYKIENYLGFESIQGSELSMKMEQHAKKFGLQIENDEIIKVTKLHDNFIHIKSKSKEYKTKGLIIASGGSPRRLNIKGEKELFGKGVSYCAVCDGVFFKDVDIAVIGGGDSACDEGDFLTKFGRKIYIIHRRDKLRANPYYQELVFKNKKIELIYDTIPTEILGENEVNGLSLKNVKTNQKKILNCKAVFIFAGFIPNNSFLNENIKLDDSGNYVVDSNYMTSIPGIYAVGDVRSGSTRQIATCVGEGAHAAIDIEKYIKKVF